MMVWKLKKWMAGKQVSLKSNNQIKIVNLMTVRSLIYTIYFSNLKNQWITLKFNVPLILVIMDVIGIDLSDSQFVDRNCVTNTEKCEGWHCNYIQKTDLPRILLHPHLPLHPPQPHVRLPHQAIRWLTCYLSYDPEPSTRIPSLTLRTAGS